MKRIFPIFFLCLVSTEALAQLPVHSIMGNSISNLHAEGDALWVGPFLNVTRDGGATWTVADADSLAGLRNRVYSIDVEGDIIWAGLGTTRTILSGSNRVEVSLARGFLFSTDRGTSWTYRSPQPPPDADPLTTGILDLPDDTVTVYGDHALPTLPITVPERSPHWDIDYDPRTGHVWTANALAGLRRSTDGGRTWQRIVLPPDTTDFLSPELGYTFPYYAAPVQVALDDFYGLNFQVFSVLVDETGTVWAGSAAGLNRSDDGGQSWRHFTIRDGLTGNFVVSVEEQRRHGTVPAIWIAARPAIRSEDTGRIGDNFGVVVTRDQGQSFEQVLTDDEPMYDFAFDDHRVYIAGFGGLFISEDGGRTFRTEREFYDPSQPARAPLPDTKALSVAVNSDGLWVGTEDGLFNSRDYGSTWRIFRADVPLSPDGLPYIVPPSLVPRVSAYAYPNPFSPGTDRLVRIRFSVANAGAATIQIFDFGMNLVRRLSDSGATQGEREVSWDGTGMDGTRVANGGYFYAVQTGKDTFWGKILVLE